MKSFLKGLFIIVPAVIVGAMFGMFIDVSRHPAAITPEAPKMPVVQKTDPIKDFDAYKRMNGCIETPLRVNTVARKFLKEMGTTTIDASDYPIYTCEDGGRVIY